MTPPPSEPSAGNGYPDAGDNASPEVQEEVDNFKEKPPGRRGVLLYDILGSGTPDYKMSQEESEYVDKSVTPGQYCGNCKFAYQKLDMSSGVLICSQVRGDILAEGWCKLWKEFEKMANLDMFKAAMLLNICK